MHTMTPRTKPPKPLPELVGTTEIAELCGVERRTVNQWRHRAKQARDAGHDSPNLLPDAEQVVSERPVWQRTVIDAWWQARQARGVPVDA